MPEPGATRTVAVSSPGNQNGNVNDVSSGAYEGVVFSEAEGEVIIADPPAPNAANVAYADVTEYVFSEAEGEVIIADPPAPNAEYEGVTESVEYTYSDEEGLVIVARPSPVPYEGRVIEAPHVPAPYEGILASWPLLVRQPVRRGYISFELSDAWDLPRPSGLYGGMSQAQLQVLSWLQAHVSEIAAAEKRWKVDRRAIAAAIAWEALENVWPASRRAVGPGKVHYESSVVEQVEEAGYLPKRSKAQRRALLETPSGAIEYIGAIMAGLADVAAQFGYNIRCNVPILTNEYQGRDLEQWRAHLARRQAGAPLEPGNTMGIWSRENMAYLEIGVGPPDRGICSNP
jgi:hypothetical protein